MLKIVLLYSEENTNDLSANRKRKGRAVVENPRTVKSPLSKWKLLEIDKFLQSRGIVELLLTFRLQLYDIVKISLFSPSLYPVPSLFSLCDSIILLWQHFKQSKSG